MIVFRAFVPHSPLLIESISKEKFDKLSDTLEAMNELAARLHDVQPDVIVTISSHSQSHETVFSANLHDEYNVSLSDFGDLSTTKTFSPALEFITKIQRRTRKDDIPFTLESSANLEYGAGVPLLILTKNFSAPIVPISYSGLDAKMHIAFGKALKDVFENDTSRVAFIASGDMSHCLSTTAPMGLKKEGIEFDSAIIEAVKNISSAKLLSMDENFVEVATQCAYRPMLILFGTLGGVKVKPDILSYESPFGVGYLVAHFKTNL